MTSGNAKHMVPHLHFAIGRTLVSKADVIPGQSYGVPMMQVAFNRCKRSREPSKCLKILKEANHLLKCWRCSSMSFWILLDMWSRPRMRCASCRKKVASWGHMAQREPQPDSRYFSHVFLCNAFPKVRHSFWKDRSKKKKKETAKRQRVQRQVQLCVRRAALCGGVRAAVTMLCNVTLPPLPECAHSLTTD